MDVERSGFRFSSAFEPTKPVIGSINGSSLRLRKRIEYRNSFQTSLSAEMHREGTGTAIVGEFAMHPLVVGFMALWFTGVVFFGILAGLAKLASAQPGSTLHASDDAGIVLFVPPGMLIFGIGLVMFGRFLARQEARFITDFLVRTLAIESSPAP